MQSSLLISDSGQFLPDEKLFQVGKVLNKIEIPTIPYIAPLFVLVKLSYISPNEQYDIQVIMYDQEGDEFYNSNNKVVHNQRDSNQTCGVDTGIVIDTPFCKPGIYECKLFVNGELSTQYPLTVTIKDK
jgi:hypothetical protein